MTTERTFNKFDKETPKRNYKDSIFRKLFNDKKELLSLYNALTGKNYPEDTEIEIVTLDNAVFNDYKNDVAFIIDRTFIDMTEHQTTLSPNLPLRFLNYIAREYQRLYFSKAIYSTTPIKIPTPEFFVLYNGPKDAPLEHTLKLSDTFAGECDTISLELIVKVININYGKGAEVLEKCRTLKEYSIFMHKIRTGCEEYGNLNTAIEESIKECIAEGILSDFLRENKGEVMSFLEVQLSVEEREAIREEDGYVRGREEGRSEGLSRGRSEGHAAAQCEIAIRLKELKVPMEQIVAATGLSETEITAL